ncbi:MAG: Crp/Fnr family transcriptional regulator [Ideonella sp.]
MSLPPQSPLDVLPAALRALAAKGEIKRYRKGTLLIQEGDFGESLYVMLSGRVKVYSIDDRDREMIFGSYGPGAYFGEMSLDGGPRSANVATLEATTCVLIGRRTLLQHISEHPEFAFDLLSRVIARARMATASARNMALLDVYQRVVQLLESLAAPDPAADGSRLLTERLTHGDISKRVGCSREMISRLMKDLVSGGYLRVDSGHRIVLLKNLPGKW